MPEITQIQIPGLQQHCVAMPHFLLELNKIMEPFEVHAGKGVAQGVILPGIKTSLLPQLPP